MFQYCFNTVPLLLQYCSSTVSVLFQHCSSTVAVLFQCCSNTVPVLHQCCSSTTSIQPASRSPPGQVWRQFFYHFGSLFESIVTPWGHFGRPWDVAFRSKNWLWRPRCTMTPQHRNKTTLLDPFWDPQNHKKSDQNHFLRGSRNGSQNRPTFREPQSEILLLFITLEQGQTSQKWTPFWELFEDQFCTKYQKMRKRRMPKNRCRKKVTLRKFDCLSEDPEAPWQPPRAPGTRNNLSNNSNNNSNSCSSCGSMLICSSRCCFFLLNVDFCFQNCRVLDETCKKRCCSLLESRGLWSDTPWAKARRIVSAKSHQCGWTTFVKWPWPCWYKWLATGNVFGVFLKATSTHSKWAQLCLNECY